jgi:hypothetical protein
MILRDTSSFVNCPEKTYTLGGQLRAHRGGDRGEPEGTAADKSGSSSAKAANLKDGALRLLRPSALAYGQSVNRREAQSFSFEWRFQSLLDPLFIDDKVVLAVLHTLRARHL